MKKIIFIFLLIIILVSCSAPGYYKYYDSISYEKLDSVLYNDETYDVLIPININDSIVHYYYLGSESSNSKKWTINFEYEYDYLLFDIVDQKLLNEVYRVIKDRLSYIENKANARFEIKENGAKDIIEKDLLNESGNTLEFVIVKSYLPIILDYGYSNYLVSLPVNIKILSKLNNEIENLDREKYIAWNDFISLPNMRNGEEIYEED